MIYVGHRDSSMSTILQYYIPLAAQIGGFLIGSIVLACDFVGIEGQGTGILLAAMLTFDFQNKFKNEMQ